MTTATPSRPALSASLARRTKASKPRSPAHPPPASLLPAAVAAAPSSPSMTPSRRAPASAAHSRRSAVANAAAAAGQSPEDHEKAPDVEAATPGAEAVAEGPTSLAPVLLAVAVAAMGAIEFGYHIAILNGPLELISSQLGFAGKQTLLGGVISSFLAGSAIGALSGSAVADSLGRRKGLIASSLPLAIGAAIMAAAQDFVGIAVGRFITGIGVGLSSSLVPVYIAEVAPTALRGTLGSVTQICICSGIVIAQVVNLVLPTTSWRAMMALAAAPAVILFLGMFAICPESPRFLAAKGQREEARKAAVWLWGTSKAGDLKGGADDAKSGGDSVPFAELFKGKNAKVALIAFMMFLFQQFSGVNAVFFYSGAVFKQAGIESVALANAVTGLLNLLVTIGAAGVIERLGRKVLLSLSYTGQGICMAVMGLTMALPALEPIRTPVILGGTLLYIMSFAVGCGPIPSLLIPEIAPERIRGYAVSLAMTSHWACNFMVGQLFLPLVDAIGVSGVYYFFAFTCICALLFISKLVPETRGRSLEEIETMMSA